MDKCPFTDFFINIDKVKWNIQCDLPYGHEGLHTFYGDNYRIQWPNKEYIETVDMLTDDIKEKCKNTIDKIQEPYEWKKLFEVI